MVRLPKGERQSEFNIEELTETITNQKKDIRNGFRELEGKDIQIEELEVEK